MTVTVGHQYRYTAPSGKLTQRHGQVVTILVCHRTQVLVRFPDGWTAYTNRRFLAPLNQP